MRADLSNYLIHFTKGKNDYDAFINLCSILQYSRIDSNPIYGNKLVCFTETPIEIIKKYGFVNETGFQVYKYFGLMFEKSDLYEVGARPALYLEKESIKNVSNDIKWRCTPYNPKFNKKKYEKGTIDFYWEREWRLCEDLEYHYHGIIPKIIVKDDSYKEKLIHFLNELHDECECEYPQIKDDTEYEDGKWIKKENDEYWYECSTQIDNLTYDFIVINEPKLH